MELSEVQTRAAELEQQISALPAGSVTKKTVNGKEYFYHRWTENKKRREKYIPADELENFRAQIERFQSTLPVWGGTGDDEKSDICNGDFNPPSPWGGGTSPGPPDCLFLSGAGLHWQGPGAFLSDARKPLFRPGLVGILVRHDGGIGQPLFLPPGPPPGPLLQ